MSGRASERTGASDQNFVTLRGLDTPVAYNYSTSRIVPVNNFTDDFSWTKGNHTIEFGGNYRLITNNRNSNANSFTHAYHQCGVLDPHGNCQYGAVVRSGRNPWSYPAVDSNFGNSYDFPMMALAGVITEIDTTYVQSKAGQLVASPDNPGAFVPRSFRDNEMEFYLQDSWRIKSNLTMMYGVRYSLLQPPYERGGNQVSPEPQPGRLLLHAHAGRYTRDFLLARFQHGSCRVPRTGSRDSGAGIIRTSRRASRWHIPRASRTGCWAHCSAGPARAPSAWARACITTTLAREPWIRTISRDLTGSSATPRSRRDTSGLDNGPRYTGLHDLGNLQSMVYPPPHLAGLSADSAGCLWHLLEPGQQDEDALFLRAGFFRHARVEERLHAGSGLRWTHQPTVAAGKRSGAAGKSLRSEVWRLLFPGSDGAGQGLSHG